MREFICEIYDQDSNLLDTGIITHGSCFDNAAEEAVKQYTNHGTEGCADSYRVIVKQSKPINVRSFTVIVEHELTFNAEEIETED